MLSSINYRKLFTFILVCLLGFTCNLSARSDDNRVRFKAAFGLSGQKWSDVNDVYTRDGHIYVLSSEGVYTKEGTEWEERKFDPGVTIRFGRPTQLVVDLTGTVFVVFKGSPSGTASLTLAQFSKNLKLRSAMSLGFGNCEEFERYSKGTLAAVVYYLGSPLVVTIAGTNLLTELIPTHDSDNTKHLVRIKLVEGHKYVLYGDDRNFSFYEYVNQTLRRVADVVIDPDSNNAMIGDWLIDSDVIKYIGSNSIHTVKDGVDTAVPIQLYPIAYSISKLTNNRLALANQWGHVVVVDQNGVVEDEFGGFGQHVLDIQEGYGGLLVDEDTVWLPGILGIKILGDNRKTITVLDSQGGVTWTQCIARYDEQSVAVAYSSISGHEFGIAIIDICTQKIEKRMLVKSEYGTYQQVAVCSDGLSKKVVALDGYGHLVSDDWKLDQHVFSVTAHGNHLYAVISESGGITKISRNGVLVEANVFPWIRSPHFAVLSNGKTTDGSNVYDANGSILATLGRYHLSVSTFGDDKFLLQVNSNTTSVVYRY
jgi:hypothetical protein